VVYEPEDPEHARIDRWRYSGPVVGGLEIAAGVLLVAAGCASR
jgi:hypothetical protein